MLSSDTQVDVAQPADRIWPIDVSLPATVIAGLADGVDSGMELGQVKLHRSS